MTVSVTGEAQPSPNSDTSFYFLCYEYLVQRHCRVNSCSREDISPLTSLAYGATAGYALWGSIYPIDVIKSNKAHLKPDERP